MTKAPQHAVVVRDLPSIIAAEFDEQPGLRLTPPQVRRLWDLSPGECEEILQYLLATGEFVRDESGRYCRRLTAFTY